MPPVSRRRIIFSRLPPRWVKGRISGTPQKLGIPGGQGGYGFPQIATPLVKLPGTEKFKKNSRELTRRRRPGGVLSSRRYRRPLGQTAIFQESRRN